MPYMMNRAEIGIAGVSNLGLPLDRTHTDKVPASPTGRAQTLACLRDSEIGSDAPAWHYRTHTRALVKRERVCVYIKIS